jgi:adenylate kinase
MYIILLGPPGAGKGTQAEALEKAYDIPHVATGDIIRANLAEGTPLGLEAKSYMEKGELVPDDLVIRLAEDRLEHEDARKGALLDGFPRTVLQAQALEDYLSGKNKAISHTLLLEVPDKDIVTRLSGRRVCQDCGAGWHTIFFPPPPDGICPRCQGRIHQRADDAEEAIANRLKVYWQQTSPLADWYQEKGLLRKIDGTGSPKEVEKALSAALRR